MSSTLAPPPDVRYRTPAETSRPVPPLVRLLDPRNESVLERIAAAADLLGDSPTLLIRLLFLRAGLPVPPGETLPELVSNLVRFGWRAAPLGLQPQPVAGALFVVTDARRQPACVGVVAKADVRGEWFYAVDGGNPERYRREAASVDFWLLPPGGT